MIHYILIVDICIFATFPKTSYFFQILQDGEKKVFLAYTDIISYRFP